MRVLILGGTTEASALARLAAAAPRLDAVLSLAGRTTQPLPQPIPVRTGGFGGTAGLRAYLREAGIDALVDATHPFAATMSAHAEQAASATGVDRVAIVRPEWVAAPGDRWTVVPGMADAAQAIGASPRRVLLTVGQQDLGPFADAPQHHYIIRSIEPPALRPPRAVFIPGRGPFDEADERRLLNDHRIEVLVSKNAGGAATRPKLDAVRGLGLPVIMVARPPGPADPRVATAAEAMAWLHRQAALRGE